MSRTVEPFELKQAAALRLELFARLEQLIALPGGGALVLLGFSGNAHRHQGFGVARQIAVQPPTNGARIFAIGVDPLATFMDEMLWRIFHTWSKRCSPSLSLSQADSAGRIQNPPYSWLRSSQENTRREYRIHCILDSPRLVHGAWMATYESLEPCPAPNGRKVRILIVEDSPLTLKSLADFLHADPAFEVIGLASDGLEGISSVERLRPDVVLMDVHMPIMNGFRATKELRSRFPKLPVILMSINSGPGWDDAAAEVGARTFIPKHEIRHRLPRLLREWFNHKT